MSDSIETNEAMARPWTRPAVSEGTASAQRVLGDAVQAQLDTLLRALLVAREFIATDRTSYADTAMREDGTMEDQDLDGLRDFDDALQVIDDAIAIATGSAS